MRKPAPLRAHAPVLLPWLTKVNITTSHAVYFFKNNNSYIFFQLTCTYTVDVWNICLHLP